MEYYTKTDADAQGSLSRLAQEFTEADTSVLDSYNIPYADWHKYMNG